MCPLRCHGDQSAQFHAVKTGADRTFLCGLIRSQGLSTNLFLRNVPLKKSASAPFAFRGFFRRWTAHVLIKAKKQKQPKISLKKTTATLHFFGSTHLFSSLRDCKQLHYYCSPDETWWKYEFIVHVKLLIFRAAVLPPAYVGVESHFAVIITGPCKVTRSRAEKLECQDFMSPCAKSVTLIAKPVN